MGGWILVFILHFQVLFGCHQMATEIRLAQQDSAETAQFQLLSWLKGLEELCKGCLPTKQKKKRKKETSRRDFIVTRHVYVGCF